MGNQVQFLKRCRAGLHAQKWSRADPAFVGDEEAGELRVKNQGHAFVELLPNQLFPSRLSRRWIPSDIFRSRSINGNWPG